MRTPPRSRQVADEDAEGDNGQHGIRDIQKKPLMQARFYAVEYEYIGRTRRQAPSK